MQPIIFATGNIEKFQIANSVCSPYNIKLLQQSAAIDEIQSEDLGEVIRDKARRAFEEFGAPVVVSDDAWNVPALGGFPGPYMKSIDHWFKPADWIRLTKDLADKRIILIQQLAYQSQDQYKLFRKEYTGRILDEPRGAYGKTLQKVVTMPGDNGLTIAEAYDNKASHQDREVAAGWHDLAEWYIKTHAK